MKKIILITFLCLCLLVGSVSAAGTYAYVANYGSNSVSVINTSTNTVSTTVTVGSSPYGVAINPAGTYAYVANHGSNTVSVINTSTNTVSATVTVGSGPFGDHIQPVRHITVWIYRCIEHIRIIRGDINDKYCTRMLA